MDEKEIKETNIWTLYNKNVDYARKHGFFTEVDRCNNFYNGDQWEGLLVDGIEKVQYNFIKPIVNYKVNMITSKLRAVNYGANNVEGTEFRATAKKVCDLFNQRAGRVWEKDQMDSKCKRIVRQAAINSEAILYTSYDEDDNNPKNEILNKVDVFYGNENEPDIQKQPYILAKQRMSVLEAKQLADAYGVSKKEQEYLMGDDDTQDQAGEKDEVNNMITIITRFYRSKGTIHFDKASKHVDICKDKDMGTTLYPFSHMIWSDKEGSARGEGEVRTLIPNQIETNKNALRRLIAVKNTAYPQKVYDATKIANPEAINAVGGVIEAKGMNVDDVRKAFTITQPGMMSPDAEKLQVELISTTRELASASDTATGQVNPENASGRAILAVQQASQQPLDDQNMALNTMLEDMARIWMDMWKTHNKKNGMKLENVETDPMTGQETITLEAVNATTLDKLNTSVRIDITPVGAFDRYAREQSLENLALSEQFMNTAWLKDYVSLLEPDSNMDKSKLEELVKQREAQQEQIRAIQERGNMMQSRIQQLMDTGQIMPREMEQYIQPTQQVGGM